MTRSSPRESRRLGNGTAGRYPARTGRATGSPQIGDLAEGHLHRPIQRVHLKLAAVTDARGRPFHLAAVGLQRPDGPADRVALPAIEIQHRLPERGARRVAESL